MSNEGKLCAAAGRVYAALWWMAGLKLPVLFGTPLLRASSRNIHGFPRMPELI
jgi:hypothetical protein